MLTVRVLGSVEVLRDDEPLDLGGPLQRAVIAHLALDVGRVVSIDRLIDRLWGDAPPRTPLGTLQSYVSRLRRALEPDRAAGAAPEILVSTAPGYVLHLPPTQIDVHLFRALAAEGRDAAGRGLHAEALERFERALALWHGPALGGIGPEEQLTAIVTRLEEERAAVQEDRFDSMLALGQHATAVPRLQGAVADDPLRERLWEQLALALYRSSRQAEALRAISTARERLLDELGLDPGPMLRDLEQQILAQDPSLQLPLAPVAAAARPAPPTEVQRPSNELVGRSREHRLVLDAVDAGWTQPQLVLLEGEPGIGKSTLCEAVVAEAASFGFTTVVGRCVEEGLAPSLWPLVEWARGLVAAEDADVDPGSNPWRRLAAGREGGSTSHVEMAEHFLALLDAVPGQAHLLAIEDLHWADRATLDVLRLVLERVDQRPLVVVATHRPVELVPGSLLGPVLGALHRTPATVTKVAVSGLDVADVARLVELTAGVAPSPEVAATVRRRAGGNPLFVTELARLSGERGLTDESVVPDAIVDVVRDRLAQLPERATAELEVAAVLGERFDLRTAMAASDRSPDECLDALDAAIVTRILVPEADGFRFAHALVRDAVLRQLAPLRMARLHHRAADALLQVHGDTADVAEPVAHHRLASASFADPLVVARASTRAADVARWRGALETADAFAERSLRITADLPRTTAVNAAEVEALEALLSTAIRREEPDGLRHVAERIATVAERTGSPAAQALALFLEWGDVDAATDLRDLDRHHLDRVRALAAATDDPYAIVTTQYMLAAVDFLCGRFHDADEHIAAALSAAGTATPDERPDHVPVVLVPLVAAVNAAMLGRPEEAVVHSHRRMPAWLSQRAEVDPSTSVAFAFTRALVHALLDEPQQVLDELLDQPRFSRTDPAIISHQAASCDLLVAWARTRLGEPGHLADAVAAMEIVSSSDEQTLRSALRAFVADAHLVAGDPAAGTILATARHEAEARGETWWLSEIIRLQSVEAAGRGDTEAAERLHREACDVATAQGAALIAARLG